MVPERAATHNQMCSIFNNDPQVPGSCRDYFRTIGHTVYQMTVLITTANFPDIMMPAYECHPASALFFIL